MAKITNIRERVHAGYYDVLYNYLLGPGTVLTLPDGVELTPTSPERPARRATNGERPRRKFRLGKP